MRISLCIPNPETTVIAANRLLFRLMLKPKITAESLKDACVKVAGELASLRREVEALNQRMGKFTRGRDVVPRPQTVGFDFKEREATPEPKSPIGELAWEIRDDHNLDVAVKALMAIGQGIDGGVREVRAVRAQLAAIADDSDLRAEFKDWQAGQRR